MTAQAITQPVGSHPLPGLRADLTLELLPARGKGFPSVVVSDPVRGAYLRLAWPESGILLHWSDAKTVEALQAKLSSTYGVRLSGEEISAVVDFAFANQLTESDQSGGWQKLAAIQAAGQHGWLKTLVHGYLFFRIPLLHPEQRLQRLLPRLSFAYSRSFWIVLGLIALAACYLASRQWTSLVAAAHDAFRLEGLAVYAVAVLILKAIHEFGHALTCVRYGCRVPSIGVAFMLGAPVLYTDTSDSWRLAQRRERLAIVFAGVAAELIVATISLSLWVFLTDGILRQLCFAFATTSVLLSLSVNLNPFMRFDGYFAFSDWVEVPNLQSRAFALMSWKLREVLFGLGHAPPEQLSVRRQNVLIGYAVLTAIYRFFLYIGIAAVVYAMAGKLIGIALGLFEVIVFIARPIYDELVTWAQLRSEILCRRRAYWTLGASSIAALIFFVPWVGTVEVPAVLTAEQEEAIYLPYPARLLKILVRDGQLVKSGDVLFTAETADLEFQLKKAGLEARVLGLQVNRLIASEKERDQRLVLEGKLARAQEKLASLAKQRDSLELRAPHDGVIADLDPEISEGIWLNQKRPLARVVAATGIRSLALVSGQDVDRLQLGGRAVFVPDDAAESMITLKVAAITPGSDGRLSEPALSERYGGGIATTDERGELVTKQGLFNVALEDSLTGRRQVARIQRGVVHLPADRVSLAWLTWQQTMRVLVREQSF